MKLHYLSVASVTLLISATVCSTSYSSDQIINEGANEAGSAYLSALPLGVITNISDFLPLEDARSFSETSKTNNRAVLKSKAWQFLKANNIQSRGIPMPTLVQSKLLLLDYMKADKASDFVEARKLLEQACELGDSRAIELMFWVLANGYNGVAGDADKAEAFLEEWMEKGYSRAIRLHRDLCLGNNQLFEADYEEARDINELLITNGNSWEARRFKREHLLNGSQVYAQDQAGWKLLTDELAEHGDQYALIDKVKGLLFGSHGYECNVDAACIALQKIPTTYENIQSIATLRDLHISTAETPTRNKIIQMLGDWLIKNKHPRSTFLKLQGLLFGLDGYDRNHDAARAFLRDDSVKTNNSEVQALLDSLLNKPETLERDAAIRVINDWLIEIGGYGASPRKYLGHIFGRNGYEHNPGELNLLLSSPVKEVRYKVSAIRQALLSEKRTPARDSSILLVNDWMFENCRVKDGKSEALLLKLKGLLFGEYGYERNLEKAQILLDSLCPDTYSSKTSDLRDRCKREIQEYVIELQQHDQTTDKIEATRLLDNWLFKIGEKNAVYLKMNGLLFGENGFELNHEEALKAMASLMVRARYELNSLLWELRNSIKYQGATPEKIRAEVLLRNWLAENGYSVVLKEKLEGLVFGKNGYNPDLSELKQYLARLPATFTDSFYYQSMLNEVRKFYEKTLEHCEQTDEVAKAKELIRNWLLERRDPETVFLKIKGVLTGAHGSLANISEAKSVFDDINEPQSGHLKPQLEKWSQQISSSEEQAALSTIVDWYVQRGNLSVIYFKCQSLFLGANGYGQNIEEASELLVQLLKQNIMHWVSYIRDMLSKTENTPQRNKAIRLLNDGILEYGNESYKEGALKFKLRDLLYAAAFYGRDHVQARRILDSVEENSEYSMSSLCTWRVETEEDLAAARLFVDWTVNRKHGLASYTINSDIESIKNRYLRLIKGAGDGCPQDLSQACLFVMGYGGGLRDLSVLYEGLLAIPQGPYLDDLSKLIIERMHNLKLSHEQIQGHFQSLSYKTPDAAYRLARIMGFVPKELL